jgi:hypothetical protein
LANPVPAISATAAAEIIKRLIIEYLLTCFFIARADNESRCAMFRDIGGSTAFCFLNAR